jgi:hypothetical protein
MDVLHAEFVPFPKRRGSMEIDEEKVDDTVLALLYLTTFADKPRWRAWKSHSWDVLD